MKKIIIDRRSNSYLAADSSWTRDIAQAAGFNSFAQALQFIREALPDRDCQVIMFAGQSSFYIAINGN